VQAWDRSIERLNQEVAAGTRSRGRIESSQT
jgi:hypothetical protein